MVIDLAPPESASTVRSIKQGQPVEHTHCGCLKRYLFATFFHFLAVNRFHLDCSTALIWRAFVEEPQVISSIWNNGSVYVLLEKKQKRPLRAQVTSSRSTSTAAITTANAFPLFLTNSLLSPGQLLQSPLGEKGVAHYSHRHPFLQAALCSLPLLAGHTAAGHHATAICTA